MNIGDRKVTIGICLYNAEPFIAAALKSALAQTHENIEVLVYNDASRDGGPAIVRSFSDPRLELIDAPQNRGIGFGRNHLSARAQGDYVTWLDNDDLFDRDRVERLLKTAVASDADITIDSYRMIDEAGAPLPGTRRVPDRIAAERHFTRLFERNAMLPHPLIHKRCFKTAKYDITMKGSDDYDMWLQCSYAGMTFARSPGISLSYRITKSSLSKNHRRNREETKIILEKYEIPKLAALYRERGFSDAHINYMRCLQHLFRGQYAEALAAASEPWPDEPEVDQDFYRASLLLRNGKPNEARAPLERHLARSPKSPGGHNNLGVLTRLLGGDGSPHFTRAAEFLPGYLDAKQNLADRTSTHITDTQI